MKATVVTITHYTYGGPSCSYYYHDYRTDRKKLDVLDYDTARKLMWELRKKGGRKYIDSPLYNRPAVCTVQVILLEEE